MELFFGLIPQGPGSKILFYKPKCISTERVFFASVQLLFQIPKHPEFCLGAAASKNVVFCGAFFPLFLGTKIHSLTEQNRQLVSSLLNTLKKKAQPWQLCMTKDKHLLIINIMSLPN